MNPGLACRHDAPLLHEQLKSNVVWQQHYSYGDPQRAFANAGRVVRVALTFPKYNSTPLETYGVVAEYLPETGRLQDAQQFPGAVFAAGCHGARACASRRTGCA